MSKKGIVRRFDFKTVVSGFVKLILNPLEYSIYDAYIYPDLLYYDDNTEERVVLRDLAKLLKTLHKEQKSHLFSISYVLSQIATKFTDTDKIDKISEIFKRWTNDAEIMNRVNDDGSFEAFKDFLKTLIIAKSVKPFSDAYNSANIEKAMESMQTAFMKIAKLDASSDRIILDPDEILNMITNGKSHLNDRCLFFGLTPYDNFTGGFQAPSLNVFISKTNGGKSMMGNHLILQCIKAKLRCWVGVLEDTQKVFLFRLISSMTGITINRLKTKFHLLTEPEIVLIKKAQEEIKKYLRIEFIYGKSIDSVHKSALDYDMECDLNKIPKPVVNIVDYTGHIAEQSSGDKKHEKMWKAYKDRKDFALKNNKICFDFAQVNREGSQNMKDNSLITHNNLSGSYDLSQVCDNIISLNRSDEDVANDKMKLHFCKSKDGPVDFTIMVSTDFMRGRFKMDDWKPYGPVAHSILKQSQELTDDDKSKDL